MKVKDLNIRLKAKRATWSLRPEISDQAVLTDIAHKKIPVGVLPELPGAIKARMPRIRTPLTAPYAIWTPHSIRRLRPLKKILPKSWDWRNVSGNNYVTAARNQGGCGSCVAFATVASTESHYLIERGLTHRNINLSESSLYFVAERQCNQGDPRWGWWNNVALDALLEEGVCTENVYPYIGVNQDPVLLESGTRQTFKISGYDSSSNTLQMKRWLVEEGPIVADFGVYHDFWVFWSSGTGVYSQTSEDYDGGHAVLVVGYDDNNSCWICKNSWGTNNSHPDGCFRIGYGEAGIDDRMYAVQNVHEIITRDEIRYNPRTLRIVNEGTRGWLLTDGRSRMKMFDNKEDARNGLRVARRHTRQGFVGRDNSQSRRKEYIMEYWTGNSRLPYEPLTKTDALRYNPNNVVAEDLDAKGWRLKDGSHWMVKAADMNDALAILDVIERHTKICFIGRGNRRRNRKDYIMTYWE